MAIRNVREQGDEVLKKISKNIEKVDDKVQILIEDMIHTMHEYNGVGLAAPQVGILKRLIVVCASEDNIISIINPEIISQEGEQVDFEGCLSVPEVYAEVKRPFKVKVKGLDKSGKDFEINGEGFLARVLCHEIDHLNGMLITDKAIKIVKKDDLQ